MRHSKLYEFNWRSLQHVAFGWLDGLADHIKPQEFILTTAILFLLVCRRYRLDARAVLDTAARVIKLAADNYGSLELRAIRTYLKEELRDA